MKHGQHLPKGDTNANSCQEGYDHKNAFSGRHHTRARLIGVNQDLANSEELLLFHIQRQLKEQMHIPPRKFVAGEVAVNGVSKTMLENFSQSEADAAKNLHKVNPEAPQHVTADT